MKLLKKMSLLLCFAFIVTLFCGNSVLAISDSAEKPILRQAVLPVNKATYERQINSAENSFILTDKIIEEYKDIYVEQVKKVMEVNTLSDSYKASALKAIKSKYTKSNKKTAINNSEFSLDEEFNKHMEKLSEYETSLGNIINKYVKAEDYTKLAASLVKEDKIKTMYKIVELLETKNLQKDERKALSEYLNKYSPYAGDTFLEKKCNEIEPADKTMVMAAATVSSFTDYDRSLAGGYIRTYTHDDDADDSVYCIPNPLPTTYTWGFPNLRHIGGDCANYASQALFVGGIPIDESNNWYCNYYVGATPFYYTPQTSSEFNSCWDIGSAWMTADGLYSYLNSRIYKTESLTNSEIKQNATYQRLFNDLWVGDLIIFEHPAGIGGWFWEKYHVSEVSGYTNPDILLASHSKNYLEDKLIDVVNRTTDNRYYIMYIKDGY